MADLELHLKHLRDQAQTGLLTKEAKACEYCAQCRKTLKRKYRTSKEGFSWGKTQSKTNAKQARTGLAALMHHPIAMKLHYEECRVKGWWDQLPPSMRQEGVKS